MGGHTEFTVFTTCVLIFSDNYLHYVYWVFEKYTLCKYPVLLECDKFPKNNGNVMSTYFQYLRKKLQKKGLFLWKTKGSNYNALWRCTPGDTGLKCAKSQSKISREIYENLRTTPFFTEKYTFMNIFHRYVSRGPCGSTEHSCRTRVPRVKTEISFLKEYRTFSVFTEEHLKKHEKMVVGGVNRP